MDIKPGDVINGFRVVSAPILRDNRSCYKWRCQCVRCGVIKTASRATLESGIVCNCAKSGRL